MARGGRYLNANKPEKKKGKAGKVVLIVLLVLALLIGAVFMVANSYLDSLLGKVTQAEFEEKNQDKSYEDLLAEMYAGMDLSSMETGPKPTETETAEETEAPAATETVAG